MKSLLDIDTETYCRKPKRLRLDCESQMFMRVSGRQLDHHNFRLCQGMT